MCNSLKLITLNNLNITTQENEIKYLPDKTCCTKLCGT